MVQESATKKRKCWHPPNKEPKLATTATAATTATPASSASCANKNKNRSTKKSPLADQPQNMYSPGVPMTKEELSNWRKQQRRERNRQSAAASRDKTRIRIEQLEGEVAYWKNMYQDLRASMATLERDMNLLKQQNSRFVSPSITTLPHEQHRIPSVSPPGSVPGSPPRSPQTSPRHISNNFIIEPSETSISPLNVVPTSNFPPSSNQRPTQPVLPPLIPLHTPHALPSHFNDLPVEHTSELNVEPPTRNFVATQSKQHLNKLISRQA